MVLTETGLAKVFQRVKSFVVAQLNSKASAIHTHSYLDITDLPSYNTPTFAYDSSTETLTVSNTTATVFNYDANSETLEIKVNG